MGHSSVRFYLYFSPLPPQTNLLILSSFSSGDCVVNPFSRDQVADRLVRVFAAYSVSIVTANKLQWFLLTRSQQSSLVCLQGRVWTHEDVWHVHSQKPVDDRTPHPCKITFSLDWVWLDFFWKYDWFSWHMHIHTHNTIQCAVKDYIFVTLGTRLILAEV